MDAAAERRPASLRWIVLLLASLVTLGDYYCYDVPAALHDQLRESFVGGAPTAGAAMPAAGGAREAAQRGAGAPPVALAGAGLAERPSLRLGNGRRREDHGGDGGDGALGGGGMAFEVWYNLLYSVYSVPNVFLPFAGGFLTDALGIRNCVLAFATLVTAGQALFAFGVALRLPSVALVGRVVFGVGGESLGVGVASLVSAWFQDQELALALALNLSFSRIGSAANDVLSPLAAEQGLSSAAWLSVLVCALSALSALALLALDRRPRCCALVLEDLRTFESWPEDRRRPTLFDTPRPPSARSWGQEPRGPGEPLLPQARSWGQEPRAGAAYGALETAAAPAPRGSWAQDRAAGLPPAPSRGRTMAVGSGRSAFRRRSESGPAGSGGAATSWSEDRAFGRPFWLLAASCGLLYGAIVPFNSISQAFLLERYHPRRVGALMAVPYSLAALLSPPVGAAVDAFGHRALWLLLAPSLLLASHLALYLGAPPSWPLAGIGAAYSVAAAVLWPAALCLAGSSRKGTAFGILTAAQNLAQAAVPVAVGAILEGGGTAPAFDDVSLLFLALAAAALLVAVMIALAGGDAAGRLRAPAPTRSGDGGGQGGVSKGVPGRNPGAARGGYPGYPQAPLKDLGSHPPPARGYPPQAAAGGYPRPPQRPRSPRDPGRTSPPTGYGPRPEGGRIAGGIAVARSESVSPVLLPIRSPALSDMLEGKPWAGAAEEPREAAPP